MPKRASREIENRQAVGPKQADPSAMGADIVGGETRVGVTRPGLREVGGSRSESFNLWILKATLHVRSVFKWTSDGDKSQQVSAIMQALRGFAPMDEIEGMMASQAIALHLGAMECFRRAAIPEQSFEVAQGLRKQGANLSRAYVEIVAALDRRRGKGMQQVVRVERVQIAAGGQAVVGNVTAGAPLRSAAEGVGRHGQIEAEPDASPARLAHDASVGAVLPTVWSESADDRETVPIAGNE